MEVYKGTSQKTGFLLLVSVFYSVLVKVCFIVIGLGDHVEVLRVVFLLTLPDDIGIGGVLLFKGTVSVIFLVDGVVNSFLRIVRFSLVPDGPPLLVQVM